ncbi:PTS sugar transporter subunit IIA [Oceanivirga salmonicida]|uniref:PTS sugar transporter subunit IIA n=1 Tax=Oceanivirga salmonicida TaxID=1769291 RepID=UPI00082A8504|nr:PTS sugar transporter subunit IIA [Oceanivirga salmonicida]
MQINKEYILLKQKAETKYDAIKIAGKILLDNDCVDETYIDAMLEREKIVTTYLGNYIAIPHGINESKFSIKKSGISIVQFPDGVSFLENALVHIVFGIAGVGEEHMDLLSKIAIFCSEEENVLKLIKAETKEEILAIFS